MKTRVGAVAFALAVTVGAQSLASHAASAALYHQSHSPHQRSSTAACVLLAPSASCFSPSQMQQVQRLLPLTVDPTPAVFQVTHLRLAGVMVSHPGGVPSAAYYLYGAAGLIFKHPDAHLPAYPKVLLVTEAKGRTLAQTGNLTEEHSGWGHVRMVFPGRNLSLTLFGNLSQQRVLQVARAIVRLSRQGK